MEMKRTSMVYTPLPRHKSVIGFNEYITRGVRSCECCLCVRACARVRACVRWNGNVH